MGKLFKRKNEFSKTIVILDIIIFLIYITVNIIMQWKKGFSMPQDINIGVFAFLTSELGLLSFIKRSKLTAETLQPQVQGINQLQQQIHSVADDAIYNIETKNNIGAG